MGSNYWWIQLLADGDTGDVEAEHGATMPREDPPSPSSSFSTPADNRRCRGVKGACRNEHTAGTDGPREGHIVHKADARAHYNPILFRESFVDEKNPARADDREAASVTSVSAKIVQKREHRQHSGSKKSMSGACVSDKAARKKHAASTRDPNESHAVEKNVLDVQPSETNV